MAHEITNPRTRRRIQESEEALETIRQLALRLTSDEAGVIYRLAINASSKLECVLEDLDEEEAELSQEMAAEDAYDLAHGF